MYKLPNEPCQTAVISASSMLQMHISFMTGRTHHPRVRTTLLLIVCMLCCYAPSRRRRVSGRECVREWIYRPHCRLARIRRARWGATAALTLFVADNFLNYGQKQKAGVNEGDTIPVLRRKRETRTRERERERERGRADTLALEKGSRHSLSSVFLLLPEP